MDWSNAAITEIASALAAAQGEFGPIVKRLTAEVQTRTGGAYRYSYADLAEVNAAVMSALSKHGIAIMQPARVLQTEPRFQADVSVLVEVQTVLLHKSGEYLAFDPFCLRAESQGPQAVGSALTYARRYSLQACLGVAPEVDDDGSAGQGNQPGGAGSRKGGDRRQRDRQQQQQTGRQRADTQPTASRPQRQPPKQPPASQPSHQQQQPGPRTDQSKPAKSAQYEKLITYIQSWKRDYPELFPDSASIWQLMRPACERLGLSSSNITTCTDVDSFREITQPVLDAIAEYKMSQSSQSSSMVSGDL